MIEYSFICPYCWEKISMLLDNSISNQKYIEDCEVCCNPIEVTLNFFNAELIDFQVDRIGQ
ncbi:CPXCG motif-containing cysteine-rich protein [Gaetbulibacter saemankumensis]|uniref:CPXCG motif-containing cysteine-rich protein n=1 Tax=Gaetbulibacter saemankumensis TaxID=311208 RepID=UPI00048771D6|nr:CPXCG motif-containing cysteine-rich protein [Gaetbulibacter saemankumensis]